MNKIYLCILLVVYETTAANNDCSAGTNSFQFPWPSQVLGRRLAASDLVLSRSMDAPRTLLAAVGRRSKLVKFGQTV